MSTMNFSLPHELKEEFDRCFQGQNKSAILAGYVRQALDDYKRQQRRAKAVDAILALRKQAPYTSDDEIQAIRKEIRQ